MSALADILERRAGLVAEADAQRSRLARELEACTSVLVVADHFLWFFHFSHLTHQAHHAAHHAYRGGPVVRPPAFGEMATFFAICA